MAADDVAEVLNQLWAVRAARKSPLPSSLPRGARVAMREASVGWPSLTGSALEAGSKAVPVLWAARTPMPYVRTESPTQDAYPAPGLRRLAERPLTAARAHLVLPDPHPGVVEGREAAPYAASLAAQYVLTARHVAENLADRASLPSAPVRQLLGEADVYRSEADRAEELLADLTAPWLDGARAELAAADGTPVPPIRPAPATVPGRFR